jgi:hypothetical protein
MSERPHNREISQFLLKESAEAYSEEPQIMVIFKICCETGRARLRANQMGASDPYRSKAEIFVFSIGGIPTTHQPASRMNAQ